MSTEVERDSASGVSPWLASLMLRRGGATLPRFAVYYQRLSGLSRGMRRRNRLGDTRGWRWCHGHDGWRRDLLNALHGFLLHAFDTVDGIGRRLLLGMHVACDKQ